MALISLAGFAHQTLSVTMITMATDLFPRMKSAPWPAWPAPAPILVS